MFLGIIFVGIIINLFLHEHELLVRQDTDQQTASVTCSDADGMC